MRRPVSCLLAVSPIFLFLLCLQYPDAAHAQCTWDLETDFNIGGNNPFSGQGLGLCPSTLVWTLQEDAPPPVRLATYTINYFSAANLFAFQGAACLPPNECFPAVVKNAGGSPIPLGERVEMYVAVDIRST